MIINSLLVVADRGSLKAYKVEELPNRSPRLRLIQSFDVLETHGRFRDKVTDQAGALPSGSGGAGHASHANSAAEQSGIEMENHRRTCKELSARITELFRQEKPEGWMLAAPAQSCAVIVDHLPAEVRERLVESVHADLVKIDPAKLPSHFHHLHHA